MTNGKINLNAHVKAWALVYSVCRAYQCLHDRVAECPTLIFYINSVRDVGEQKIKLMKTKLTTIATVLLTLMLALTNVGCKKEAGPKGDTGPAGTNGNANVKSQTSTVSTWSWDGAGYYNFSNINVPSLTSDIANTGAVMVYLQTTSGEWAALPRTIALTSAPTSMNQRFVYTTGNVKIIIQNSDLTQPTSSSIVFKIVCIASTGMIAHPNVNLLNYNDVKNTFKLQD